MTFCRCGYLFIAAGNCAFLDEARESVRSLRRQDPGAAVTLVTNLPERDVQRAADGVFDTIIRPDPLGPTEEQGRDRIDGHLFKSSHMYDASPYDRTFFVDTDTRFLADCSDLFNLLDYFDLCLAHAPADTYSLHGLADDLSAYTPYNSGVMLFRKNDRMQGLFEKWGELHTAGSDRLPGDQAALMHALLECDRPVHTYVLQSTMNFRTPFNERLVGPVRIMHGRPEAPERVAREVNRSGENRVWLAEPEICVPLHASVREQLRVLRKLVLHMLRMCRYRMREFLSRAGNRKRDDSARC